MASHVCTRSRRIAYDVLTPLCRPGSDVPTFLAPSIRPHSRLLSTTAPRQSKIGGAALSIPEGVQFEIINTNAKSAHGVLGTRPNRVVEVTGPLGKMSMRIPQYVDIVTGEEGKTRQISVSDVKDKKQRAMWGTIRAYLNNHILGVSEGHTAILRLIGVGYRATVESTAVTQKPQYSGQKFVSLKVGYSHPIELGVPKGVTASVPQPTRILLEGVEKEVVMQFAAKIRAWRVPEPYKGKGIFVNGETIKLKAKKIK